MTNTTNTAAALESAIVRRATEYLRKYGPTGTYTSTNAPYGVFVTIENYNPFFSLYGDTDATRAAYAVALAAYKPRKRTTRAGETFRY